MNRASALQISEYPRSNKAKTGIQGDSVDPAILCRIMFHMQVETPCQEAPV